MMKSDKVLSSVPNHMIYLCIYLSILEFMNPSTWEINPGVSNP